jgi:CubicO group peptidase (beta-lactamase class C family)
MSHPPSDNHVSTSGAAVFGRRSLLAGGAGLAAVVAAGLASPAAAATPAIPSRGDFPNPPRGRKDPFEAVAAVVREQMKLLKVPGVALGVLKDGVLQLRGFGITNIDTPQPVDENTIFNLASLSKTVTATAVMSLVEQGRIDLEAPVKQYLPHWRVGDEASTNEMLIRHLVTHSTGLNGPASTRDLGNETLARFEQEMDRLVRIAPPGAIWSYLNPGFALAGRLVEVATGTDIHTAFRNLVFDPLGLEHSSTRLDLAATYRLAVGHQPADHGRTAVVRPFSMGSSIPAGGVCMSIADLMRYAAFHLNEGDAGSVGIISPKTRELMRTPQLVKAPTDDWMAIGWHLRTVGGVTTAAHGGTAGAGHRLLLELVPGRRLAFAILTNHVDGWRLNQVVEHALLSAYEGLALEPNQHITYRGINEDFTLHATPLKTQPDPAEYVGSYLRGQSSPLNVTVEDGQLRVGNSSLFFFAPDLAYTSDSGTPCEFIRNDTGAVTWIRSNGQGFARKEGM